MLGCMFLAAVVRVQCAMRPAVASVRREAISGRLVYGWRPFLNQEFARRCTCCGA